MTTTLKPESRPLIMALLGSKHWVRLIKWNEMIIIHLDDFVSIFQRRWHPRYTNSLLKLESLLNLIVCLLVSFKKNSYKRDGKPGSVPISHFLKTPKKCSPKIYGFLGTILVVKNVERSLLYEWNYENSFIKKFIYTKNNPQPDALYNEIGKES